MQCLQAFCSIAFALSAESAQLIDLGSGLGKTMWHGAVFAALKEPPKGVEISPRLVSRANKISQYVIKHLPDEAQEKGWRFNMPEVI